MNIGAKSKRLAETRQRITGSCRLPSQTYRRWLLRHYNPGAGRWLSRDPIGERGGSNIYVYVKNCRTNTIDYLGLKQFGYTDPDRIPQNVPSAQRAPVANVDITAVGQHLCDDDKAGEIEITIKVTLTGNQSRRDPTDLENPNNPNNPWVRNGNRTIPAQGEVVSEGQTYAFPVPAEEAAGSASSALTIKISVAKCPTGKQTGTRKLRLIDRRRTLAGEGAIGQEYEVTWEYECEKGSKDGKKCCQEKSPFTYDVKNTAGRPNFDDPPLP